VRPEALPEPWALRARREALTDHNPEAIVLAGAALAAMRAAAYHRVPSIRCDRQARYRAMQLAGEKVLPLEDLTAIALEGPTGAAVALAALGAIAGKLGYVLVPCRPSAGEEDAFRARLEECFGAAFRAWARERAREEATAVA
jgi:hypothetical protein